MVMMRRELYYLVFISTEHHPITSLINLNWVAGSSDGGDDDLGELNSQVPYGVIVAYGHVITNWVNAGQFAVGWGN